MYNNAIRTYHRGARNYGTGYDMMKRIDELEAKRKDDIEAAIIKGMHIALTAPIETVPDAIKEAIRAALEGKA
jgi:mannose/fructose/N-acetylgalactosamine-specific phosphotransferase system component IID